MRKEVAGHTGLLAVGGVWRSQYAQQLEEQHHKHDPYVRSDSRYLKLRWPVHATCRTANRSTSVPVADPRPDTCGKRAQTRRVAITRLNPEQLHRTAGYAHVTIVDSGRLAILAGQCPLDVDGNLIGRGDVLAQVDQIVANATVALEAAGTHAENVVRSVIYVVSDDSDVLASVWKRLTASGIGAAFTTASTLLGVAALGYRDQLVEVDLTAALP